MIYTALVLAAASAINPLANLVHFHPKAAQPDTRVAVTLVNKTNSFRDVKVDGHTYTLTSGHSLTLKAPTGTKVYADSLFYTHKRGDLMFEVSPAQNNQTIRLN